MPVADELQMFLFGTAILPLASAGLEREKQERTSF
jgi:hypothetical protein